MILFYICITIIPTKTTSLGDRIITTTSSGNLGGKQDKME